MVEVEGRLGVSAASLAWIAARRAMYSARQVAQLVHVTGTLEALLQILAARGRVGRLGVFLVLLRRRMISPRTLAPSLSWR